MGAVEALLIFDEHNNAILDHSYTGRPASAATVLANYLAQPKPRPSILYLPNSNPPTLVCALVQDRLLFLCTSSTDTEPLQLIEYLKRLTDVLEDFLGAPLLASKIEASFDVVLQVVDETCDAGIICNTEPNMLKETVETPSWVGSILGGFGLPSSSPSLPTRSGSPSLPGLGPLSLQSGGLSSAAAANTTVPWRKSNVRHTSNELYVDIVERLSVVLAPSGRPLSAMAHGTVVFTAQISGVPDLILTLSAPGGRAGIENALGLPSFHPCVRLSRWADHPGELSFVPPDGRFVLAGYECNLLPDAFSPAASTDKLSLPNVKLPATVELSTGVGAYGDQLEARLFLPLKGTNGSSAATTRPSATDRLRAASSGFGGSANQPASSSSPVVEDLVVTIPVPPSVRNVTDLRAAKGEAHFIGGERIIEWRISTKDAGTITSAGVAMKCTLVGPIDDAEQAESSLANAGLVTDTSDYTDDLDPPSQTGTAASKSESLPNPSKDPKRNQGLMPRSASVSFSIKGWLASGVRVDRLSLQHKASKGLGAGITPYKGVKYHTVSRHGIEVRC